MVLKAKWVTFTSALLLAGSVFSAQEIVCPDINDIKAQGLAFSELIQLDYYVSYAISNYNTDSEWGFMIAPIQAESTELALDKGNQILSTISAPGVLQSVKPTLCEYATDSPHIMALAIQDELPTPMKLKAILNNRSR
jgi:hypothetical protein